MSSLEVFYQKHAHFMPSCLLNKFMMYYCEALICLSHSLPCLLASASIAVVVFFIHVPKGGVLLE